MTKFAELAAVLNDGAAVLRQLTPVQIKALSVAERAHLAKLASAINADQPESLMHAAEVDSRAAEEGAGYVARYYLLYAKRHGLTEKQFMIELSGRYEPFYQPLGATLLAATASLRDLIADGRVTLTAEELDQVMAWFEGTQAKANDGQTASSVAAPAVSHAIMAKFSKVGPAIGKGRTALANMTIADLAALSQEERNAALQVATACVIFASAQDDVRLVKMLRWLEDDMIARAA